MMPACSMAMPRIRQRSNIGLIWTSRVQSVSDADSQSAWLGHWRQGWVKSDPANLRNVPIL